FRQSGCAKVLGHAAADTRKRAAEFEHPIEFRRVAKHAPLWVIAVLLSAARIAACRLKMAVGVRADPHIAIGWRDNQFPDALDDPRIRDAPPARVAVNEMLAAQDAAEAWLAVAGVAQPCDVSGSRRRPVHSIRRPCRPPAPRPASATDAMPH